MSNNPKFKRTQVLNIEIDNLTSQELLESFEEGFIVTPNVDHMMRLQRNEALYQAYKHATLRVCDSRIIFLLVNLLFPKHALKEQITGSDFFPAFCQYHAKKQSARIFLLGGSEASIVSAQQNINNRAGTQIVVGSYSPPFGFENSNEETQKILNIINNSRAETLAVGVGSPKQEIWICNNKDKLPAIKRFLAIGATIEFESGNLKRAPKWMTKAGLEWLFRLSQEPNRLAKRYFIDDLPFFLVILRQRLGLYSNPWRDRP